MKIIKSTEPIPVDHPVFLIYGQPGIAKTSLGYSAKDPLLLDCDKGAHRAANRRDTVVIDSWKDAADITAQADALESYSTIVVDTVGRCIDMIVANGAKTDPKKFPGGNPSQQGWGVVKSTFRNWLNAMRGLGKDVLLIAHDKEDKDGESRIMRADIAGGSYSEVFKSADFVGYLCLSGKQRILDFSPTDRWIGKNPGQWEPLAVPPIAKATDFMAKLMDEGRAVLGKISEESATVAKEVDEWRKTIDKAKTIKDCNDALETVLKIQSPVVAPQVKRLLMDHCKAIGCTYSTEEKKFIEQVPVHAS